MAEVGRRALGNGHRGAVALAFVVVLASCGQPGLEFSPPKAISAVTNVGVAPMFAVSPNGNQAVAWISASGGGTDGRLYISVDGAQPSEISDTLGPIEAHGESPPKIAYGPDGSLHAIYVVAKVVPDARFPLAALRHVASRDGGKTWTQPMRVTDDMDFGSHNFHALHITQSGRVYAAWLDGRLGKSGAYITWSDDNGATWNQNIRASVDEACPCCRTAIASDTGGVVYLAWRTVLPGNIRDIVVARSTNGGATWDKPERVHADGWVFDGCPHAGPSLAVDAKHRLHAVWWTGKQRNAGVFYARADDGVHFGEPVPIAVKPQSAPSHVQLAVEGDRVAITWDDGFVRVPTVNVRVSNDGGGTFGEPIIASDKARVASFPVLALTAKEMTLAWTEEDPSSHDKAEAAKPNMKDPNMHMGLSPVGEAKVVSRTARLAGK